MRIKQIGTFQDFMQRDAEIIKSTLNQGLDKEEFIIQVFKSLPQDNLKTFKRTYHNLQKELILKKERLEKKHNVGLFCENVNFSLGKDLKEWKFCIELVAVFKGFSRRHLATHR